MQGPTALTLAQAQIAVKPALGGEMKVYVTKDQAFQLAAFQIVAANSGVNVNGSPFAFGQQQLLQQQNGYPQDLIVIADTPIQDVGPVTFIVYGTTVASGSTVVSGVAIFEAPTQAGVSAAVFEPGWAADVIPYSGAGNTANPTDQWTSYKAGAVICSSAVATLGYSGFSIWAMPNVSPTAPSNYFLMGATQEKSFTTRSQRPTAISAGLDAGAFIKPGEIPVGTFNVRQRWISMGDGMARFDGQNVVARIDVVKEQTVLDQRIYVMGATLSIDAPSAGEMASPGEVTATVLYSKMAVMPAMLSGQPTP